MNDTEQLQSYHIFLFPFKWEYVIKNSNGTFHERTNPEHFLRILDVHKEYADHPKKAVTLGWQHDPFNLDRADKYNEFNYFYDYVREALYDFDNALQVDHYEQSQVHLEYRLPTESHYKVTVLKEEKKEGKTQPKEYYPKEYKLPIESILLNIYSSGVGILSFHLSNQAYNDLQSILDINQYGRRLYPPFLGIFEAQSPVDKPKTVELASEISLDIPDQAPDAWKEAFHPYNEPSSFKHGPFLFPKFIQQLFADKSVHSVNSEYDRTSGHITISPVLDDRMYVVSWCQNKKIINLLANPTNKFTQFCKSNDKSNDKSDIGEANQEWYKYLFIDANSPNCGDGNMFQSLLAEHTYKRWLVPNWGTVYGTSRYSFVAMAAGDSEFRHHVTGMYYKMVELCLLQRASVLRFSDEITHVTKLEKEGKSIEQITDQIRSLYSAYLHFVNKVYFREVTAQDQGIELYDLIQDKMRIGRHVKELESEIGELHQYALLMEEKRRREIEEEKKLLDEERNEQAHILNKIAFIILPATVVAGFFGFSTIDTNFRFFEGSPDSNFWGPFIIALAASLLGWFLFEKYIKKNKS